MNGNSFQLFFGGTLCIIQPNDQLMNKRFQATFRGLVRQYILDTRKTDFANGIDRSISNLAIHQLVDFSFQAFRSVTTIQMMLSVRTKSPVSPTIVRNGQANYDQLLKTQPNSK